jgi:mono/diheme cytochrome c family protein
MWWSTLAGAALALAVTAAGYDTWSRALPLPTGQAADAVDGAAAQSRHELGRKVYNFRCYFCHGYSGDAKTLAATYLTPAPRDFTAAAPAEWPVARIAEVLRQGRDGTAMKSFRGILDEEELHAVAAFFHLQHHAAGVQAAGQRCGQALHEPGVALGPGEHALAVAGTTAVVAGRLKAMAAGEVVQPGPGRHLPRAGTVVVATAVVQVPAQALVVQALAGQPVAEEHGVECGMCRCPRCAGARQGEAQPLGLAHLGGEGPVLGLGA